MKVRYIPILPFSLSYFLFLIGLFFAQFNFGFSPAEYHHRGVGQSLEQAPYFNHQVSRERGICAKYLIDGVSKDYRVSMNSYDKIKAICLKEDLDLNSVIKNSQQLVEENIKDASLYHFYQMFLLIMFVSFPVTILACHEWNVEQRTKSVFYVYG